MGLRPSAPHRPSSCPFGFLSSAPQSRLSSGHRSQNATDNPADVYRCYVPYHLFWSPEKTASIPGPFDNEHDLNMGFVGKLPSIAEQNHTHSYKADSYERNFSRALNNHPSTFTHSDMQQKHIIVQEIPANSPDQKKDYEVSLIGWEETGWSPTYSEYAAAAVTFYWDDDWPAKFEDFVDPWPAEAAALKTLRCEIFF